MSCLKEYEYLANLSNWNIRDEGAYKHSANSNKTASFTNEQVQYYRQ